MKILAPINSIQDVLPVIKAGANELYCGIIPKEWRNAYNTVVSPNRREWISANITDYKQLEEIVLLAHQKNVRVFLTLNALYINSQDYLLEQIIKEAVKCKIDAFIVADIGLVFKLKQMNIKQEIHISTGGTVFNSETAKFYESLGVQRIAFPRHVQPKEMEKIIKSTKNIKYEVFILNSGCKNIDGYCTFLHGVQEQKNLFFWKYLKKANFDRFFFKMLNLLPQKFIKTLNFSCLQVDSPCIMKYNFDIRPKRADLKTDILKENLKSYFSIMSGMDPCGVCRIKDFKAIGIESLKIVGRNYSTNKKIVDIMFVKDILDKTNIDVCEFNSCVKKLYKYYYKADCKNICYYPI